MIDFSIIVPVFNTKQVYLRNCIESVIAQNNLSWEMLIIDDGSSNEDTIEFLESLPELYPHANIKLIRQDNNGVSTARNRGISEAKGNYNIGTPWAKAIKRKFIED